MDIVRKRFGDISYEDVENLVKKKFEETDILEYKEKFNPRDFDKLISSFANTFGGIIILGVKEKKGTSQPEKIVNVGNSDLENAIDSICWRKISPPVSCDRKYLQKPKGRTKIFVIKVYESDLTPHTVENGTAVYYRAKAQRIKDDNYKKADLEHIDWLKNRRMKYVERRNQIIDRYSDRLRVMLHYKEYPYPITEYYIMPKYPRETLIETPEIYEFLGNFRFKYGEMGREKAIQRYKFLTHLDGASFVQENNEYAFINYSELGKYGYYKSTNIFWGANKDSWSGDNWIYSTLGGSSNWFNLSLILKRFFKDLIISLSLLKALNFRGNALIAFKLRNCANRQYFMDLTHLGVDTNNIRISNHIEDKFEYCNYIDFADIVDNKLNIFGNTVENLLFTLNAGHDLEDGFGKLLGEHLTKSLLN